MASDARGHHFDLADTVLKELEDSHEPLARAVATTWRPRVATIRETAYHLADEAAAAGYGVGVVARPSIFADTFGVTRFAGVIAATAVPMALARAAAPLAGAWILDWRFPVLLGGITLLAAVALIPVAIRPTT